MTFDSYPPPAALAPFVRSLVISESEEDNTYRVLAGTGLVIGFQYSGRLALVRDGSEMPLSAAGITGLHDQYKLFRPTAGTGSVLVFFRDGGAAAFFDQPINELFRESLSLDHFMLRSQLVLLQERLCTAPKNTDRITIVEL